jgi:hypothetical protein
MKELLENAQMEMTLGIAHEWTGNAPHPHRRAQWWFQRMRLVVDRALDWQPAPQPPPEQVWLPGACRLHDLPAFRPSDFGRIEQTRAAE